MFQLPSRTRKRIVYVSRNRTAEIITISVLIATFMLLGVGLMLWAVRTEIAFGPTPTPTATSDPTSTSTPDFRATHISEDMLTQVAYAAAQATLAAGVLGPVSPIAVVMPTSDTLTTPASESTGSTVMLPSISSGGVDSPLPLPVDDASNPGLVQTATSVALLPIVSAPGENTPVPQSDSPLPLPNTPLPTPTTPPGVIVVVSPTTTDTPSPIPLPPTATFTPAPPLPPTPTATATLAIIVNNLNAVVGAAGGKAFQGPGSRYPSPGAFNPGPVTLINRDSTGEWVYACCIASIPYWVRQAQAQPANNPTPVGAPTNSPANDVRWLAVSAGAGNLQPAPTVVPTPPLPDDFPVGLRERTNSNRVVSIPLFLTAPSRFNGGLAGAAYVSPIMIANGALYAISADNNIYSIDKNVGNQRWRYPINNASNVAPAVAGQVVYLVTQAGLVYALQDQGAIAAPLWQQPINATPATDIKLIGDKLLIGGRSGNASNLFALDRNNGAVLKTQGVGNVTILSPAIGNHLVYIAGDKLYALDVDDINTIVWSRSDLPSPMLAAPVYVAPGGRGLAELFVIDSAGRVYTLDANTGNNLAGPWGGGEGANSMTVADSALIISGPGYVRAISRSDGRQLWNNGIAGLAVGGPLTDGQRVLVMTSGGTALLIDIATGALQSIAGNQSLLGAAALSGLDLYVAGSDGNLYVWRGGR